MTDTPRVIALLDINKKIVYVSEYEVYNSLRDMKLFGMTPQEILEFRYQYTLRGGPFPITKNSIKEIFENKQT